MNKLFQLLFTDPLRVYRLFNKSNIHTIWNHLRSGEYSKIFDLFKRLDKRLSPVHSRKIHLYKVTNIPDKLNFPIYDKPIVSIIIPVFNHWKQTRNCLVSILHNAGAVPYELIIADDGSNDETRNIITFASNIKIIANKTNLGFLKNCNNASYHATGRYLLFLNNDTIVQPQWLISLVSTMDRDDNIGLVGSKLIYPDGRLQEAGGIIWQDGSGRNYGRYDSPEKPEYNYLKESDYLSGASILVRKSLWDDIGGFDEQFAPAYYEDTDLAYAIRNLGYKVVYQPLSAVIHHEGTSHGVDTNSDIKAYQEINRNKFLKKWQTTLIKDNLPRGKSIFNARDRSSRKKTLLFIDRYVPLYDQDAGSKSTFQYLQLLSEMGYNIKYLCDDFIDHQPYTTTLQQMGIEVLFGSWYQQNWEKWIIDNGHHFDYIYLSRPFVSQKYIHVCRSYTSAKLFYCGHDLHYLRRARRDKLISDNSSQQVDQLKATELNIIRSVDISYFFSSYEIQELTTNLKGCVIHQIPVFFFDDTVNEEIKGLNFDNRNGLLFVGGFLHQPNADAVTWFIEEIFPLIRAKIPAIHITVAGSNPPAHIRQFSGTGVIITGRLSEKELLEQYQLRRVVVAPLRYGAGVKGKIIEAMYYGVPTVTTSIGAEGIENADHSLFIADDPHVFAENVIRVYTHSTIWDNISNEASKTIKRYFSKNVVRKTFEQDMPPF